jgi:hypothetical protein
MSKIHASAIIHRDRPYHGLSGERQSMHPTERFHRHGKVRPMEEPGFFRRLFGAR